MRRLFAFCLTLLGLALAARADPPPKVFSHPSRIRYDGQCLSIDDQDVLIFSGSFDPSRFPRPLWRERFRQIREAGCNAVEIKVPKNMADLADWLRLSRDEFGLYSIVCPAADAAAALAPAIAAGQITRQPAGRPGVILVQIEGADLPSLYRQLIAGGIDVPLFTCGMKECRDSADPLLSQVFDSVSAGSRIDLDAVEIADLESAQVDAPAMISGLFGPSAALAALENGATILNCDVPAASIGRMLGERGAALARSHPVRCQAETGNPEVTVTARRTREGATYLFFRNHSPAGSRHGAAAVWLQGKGEVGVDYVLEPSEFKMLYLAPGVRWPFESGRNVRPEEPKENRQTGVAWLP